MALTSDEINFLIYRYLRESGFEHSAYAFGHESFIYKSSLESSSIPPGALISFVQKGLQYAEIETHVNDDGTETICEESFSIMKKHVCKPRPVKRKIFSAFDSLDSDCGQLEIDDARILRTDPDPVAGDGSGSSSVVMRNMAVCVLFHPFVPVEKNSKKGNPFAEQQTGTLLTALADGTIKIWQWREEDEDEEKKEETAAAAATKQPFQKGYVCVRTIPHPGLASSLIAAATSSSTTDAIAAAATAATPAEPTAPATTAADETMTDANTLTATDPSSSSTSSSSSSVPATAEDSNKRQKLTDGSARDASAAPSTSPCNLHTNHSIISVDWHPRGSHFASASYSGLAFLYNSKGELLHTLNKHTAPLTRIKFHPTGSLLLTASVDHTTCVWDVETGALKRQWHLHSGPVLDVDWCSVWAAQSAKSRDTSGPLATDPENAFKFASCSTDGRIFVVDVRDELKEGESAAAAAAASSESSSSSAPSSTAAKYAPVCLEGHEGEVNSISWDPSGTLLLSSSDDCSLKIWKASNGDILHDFIDHDKAVLTARWSGTGPCTEYPKSPLFVASGSADTTVKLFDPNNGRCLFTLTQHTHPVSIVAFAPRQQLLATASHERVFVWSLHSGSLIKTFKNLGDPLAHSASQMPIGRVGGLNDLAFDNRGEKIAVSYADGMTYVLDLLDSAIPAAASSSK